MNTWYKDLHDFFYAHTELADNFNQSQKKKIEQNLYKKISHTRRVTKPLLQQVLLWFQIQFLKK